MFAGQLRFKVLQYEEQQNGSRIYYGSRSFEGKDGAEKYKRELEERYQKERGADSIVDR